MTWPVTVSQYRGTRRTDVLTVEFAAFDQYASRVTESFRSRAADVDGTMIARARIRVRVETAGISRDICPD